MLLAVFYDTLLLAVAFHQLVVHTGFQRYNMTSEHDSRRSYSMRYQEDVMISNLEHIFP